jgi:alcohol dehydrogenase (NADP+)
MLSSGWGPTPYPCCVGHEIVGKAVRVGKEVKNIKVGDRVGVGAQAQSCLECVDCKNGNMTYCKKAVNTYGSVYPNGKDKSYGGYSNYNRTHGAFVVKIPEKIESADAAPMLCGGVTVYSPLVQNGCGPGKTVGIVGVGGLGPARTTSATMSSSSVLTSTLPLLRTRTGPLRTPAPSI